MKRDTWRQENPLDQMVALLSAQAGHLSLIRDETILDEIRSTEHIAKVDDLNTQLMELVPFLKGTKPWVECKCGLEVMGHRCICEG